MFTIHFSCTLSTLEELLLFQAIKVFYWSHKQIFPSHLLIKLLVLIPNISKHSQVVQAQKPGSDH